MMNDMYLHHHPNKVSMAANGGGQQLDANAGKRLKPHYGILLC